jgi:hypothetical protein
VIIYGYIGQNGEFVPSYWQVEGGIRSRQVGDTGYRSYYFFSGNNPDVYEYRSGRLIPGKILQRRFVPDRDGNIIDFKDYKYSPTSRQIYNLPGIFIEKDG